MKIEDLENKRVAIWGLGKEGRAVLEFLQSKFINKKIDIIEDSDFNDFDEELFSSLKNYDVIIRSPGVSIYKPEIVKAKIEFGTIFITEKSLFFAELEDKNTIAITGTKGKTTTATFCAYLLEKMGYTTLLCGNMGTPAIELTEKAKSADFIVIELSSYQTSDLISFPKVSILLNLFPEHRDWHKTHNQYYLDKINLLNGSKIKIINGNDSASMNYTKLINDKILFNTKTTINYSNNLFYDINNPFLSSKNMKLLGEHNYQNICGVFTALKSLNIDLKTIKQEFIDNFEPVAHRLEVFKNSKKSILFVNDSISTIPEATLASYKTFSNKNIYAILGGYDRGQDYEELVNYIVKNSNIKYLCLIGQTKSVIAELLEKKGYKNFHIKETIEDCMDILSQKAEKDKNSAIVLSPAAASYDMFKNFEERGDLFKKFALEL